MVDIKLGDGKAGYREHCIPTRKKSVQLSFVELGGVFFVCEARECVVKNYITVMQMGFK